ncbi:unnamed protein product [Schistosoma turkestanicum]|nr:unnamed protein product [Schistosoma turkestanicum]
MVEQNGDYLKQLGINMNNLEKEMNSAIAKESRYWLENDAKIRAVQQGVPTYDDFRELVAGCHLKPLDRSELTNTIRQKSSWNYSTTLLGNNNVFSEPGMNSPISTKSITTPQEFIVRWRHIKSSSTVANINESDALSELLFSQNSELLENLFNTGLGVSLLPDIISVLNHVIDNTEEILSSADCKVNMVFMILASFQKSKQFSVAVDCLLDNEKETARNLIQKIEEIVNKSGNFQVDSEILKKMADAFK